MGVIVNAVGTNCDFKTTFNFGGNRFNFLENCPVPAINLNTGCFENINYKIESKNPRYEFYSNKKLKGNNGNNQTLRSFDIYLNTKNNFCPKCKMYRFDFYQNIYVD